MWRRYGLRGHEGERLEYTRNHIGKICFICTRVPTSQDQLIATSYKTYYAFIARLRIPIKTNSRHPIVRVRFRIRFESECWIVIVSCKNALVQVTKILERISGILISDTI